MDLSFVNNILVTLSYETHTLVTTLNGARSVVPGGVLVTLTTRCSPGAAQGNDSQGFLCEPLASFGDDCIFLMPLGELVGEDEQTLE